MDYLRQIALSSQHRAPKLQDNDVRRAHGFFTCEVWTVGEQYIAAYHVDCNAGSYTAQKNPGSLWNQAILGYGPRDEVSDAVRKGVRAMVELFAATFVTARTEGGSR